MPKKIETGISFEQYIEPYFVPVGSPDYAKLKGLYEEIQVFRTFIDYSSHFKPIGDETRKLFRKNFDSLPGALAEEGQAPEAFVPGSGVVPFILEAERREARLTRLFEALLEKYKV